MELRNFDYDLKNELPQLRNCKEDALYKFLLYKANESTFDCDRCDYAKNVYHSLWGWDKSCQENFQMISVGGKQILMGMDTMNSFWKTFEWALSKWCGADIKREFGISQITTKHAEMLCKKYDVLKKIMIKNLSQEIVEQFVVFAKLTHTIGNLTLVPKKIEPYTQGIQTFNTARASKWNDYFDLSLIWLFYNEDKYFTRSVACEYATQFLLSDYISENHSIIPLIKSHEKIINGNYELEKRPTSKGELLTLLETINNRIVRRGQWMYSKITNSTPGAMERDSVAPQKIVPPLGGVKDKKSSKKIVNYIPFYVLWFTLSPILLIVVMAITLLGAAVFYYGSIVASGILLVVLLGVIGIIIAMTLFVNSRRNNKILRALDKQPQSKEIRIWYASQPPEMKEVLVLAIVELLIGVIGVYLIMKDFTWYEGPMMLFCLIYTMVFIWKVLYVGYVVSNRCRNCKCIAALEQVNLISRTVDWKNVKRKDFEETIAYDEYGNERILDIPVTRRVVQKKERHEETYKCKWCGQSHIRIYHTKEEFEMGRE